MIRTSNGGAAKAGAKTQENTRARFRQDKFRTTLTLACFRREPEKAAKPG
jgi:hypothetical protein